MGRQRLRWLAIGLVAPLLLLVACNSDDSSNDVEPTQEPTATLVSGVHSPAGSPSPAASRSATATSGQASATPPAADATVQAGGAASPTATSGAGTAATATPTPAAAPPAPATGGSTVVARMRIPSIGVDHPIEQLGLVPGRNQLDTPRNATGAVGWYSIYDAPGSGQNVLFSAHINYNGADGPFARLSQAPVGAEIVAVMADGVEYRYTIFSSQRYAISAQYATASQPEINMDSVVFAPAKPGNEEWVTLITCSCEPGRIIIPPGQQYGDCVDRDVVIAKRVY